MFVAAVDATIQSNNDLQNQLTIGSTMTSTQCLTSSSGDFVFGFYSSSSSGDPNNNTADQQLLLAIWFNLNNGDGPPAATNNKMVVVWFAKDSASNRTVVATRQSVVKFSDSGRVSLVDGGGGGQSEIELWSPSGQQPLGSALVLQDSGNLQLIAQGRRASFGDPTDTLLPGQNMSNRPGKYLQSRSTDTDFAPGRFTLNVQDDGNIVLYMKQLEVATDLGAPYWATTTFGTGKVPTLFFNDSGNLYYSFSGNESGAVNLTARRPLDSFQMYYHYAALDPDGTVRVYVHRKKNSTGGDDDGGSWDVFAHFPTDGCSRRTNFGLQGMCGPNAFCTSSSSSSSSSSQEGADERLGCECPYGYEFVDERHRYKGCRPSFVPHACSDDGGDSEFVTKEVPYTSWSNQSTYKKFMLTADAHDHAGALQRLLPE
ncbi:LOW QUALITY PROTEIN: hypothetical protein U9M48_040892 [Paspalum notatum var. saurae]|uniref:non-specific serine/threonine protein kinase n=1 Tax=Paspalum notatum var. saurae TaxID=547442 RepID=A0AAQ3US19_PASNO